METNVIMSTRGCSNPIRLAVLIFSFPVNIEVLMAVTEFKNDRMQICPANAWSTIGKSNSMTYETIAIKTVHAYDGMTSNEGVCRGTR